MRVLHALDKVYFEKHLCLRLWAESASPRKIFGVHRDNHRWNSRPLDPRTLSWGGRTQTSGTEGTPSTHSVPGRADAVRSGSYRTTGL